MSPDDHLWFADRIAPGLVLYHGVQAVLFRGTTKYQRFELLDTTSFGLCLVLDGKPQSAEADEFIYHEALVHPALLGHPGPQRVFIAGGGEGATLREVLSHSTVTSAVMVDLDEEVVRLCQQHLPQWHHGAFQDPRVKLVFADAREFLSTRSEVFDVIINDITDPTETGPSSLLFTQEFFRLIHQRLAPDGVTVVQAGYTTLTNSHLLPALVNTVRSIFPVTVYYHAFVPSFGGDWGFVLGSKGPNPQALFAQEVDSRIAQRIGRPLRFYDGPTHQGMFLFPKFVREAVAKESRIITEKSLLFV
jgi:spermidine synthase